MMRAVLLMLPLSTCVPEAPPHPEPPFRSCLAVPAPLPAVRTIEALREREKKLEAIAIDCSIRLDAVVKAWPR